MEIEARISRLRKYNLIMGAFHLIQGILMLALSSDFSLPIRNSFLHHMPETDTLNAITEDIVDLQIGPLVAVFLFMSAIAHFAVASPGLFGWYSNNLKRGINYARWYEMLSVRHL